MPRYGDDIDEFDIKVLLGKPWGTTLMVEITEENLAHLSTVCAFEVKNNASKGTMRERVPADERFDNQGVAGLSMWYKRETLVARRTNHDGIKKRKFIKIANGDVETARKEALEFLEFNDDGAGVEDDHSHGSDASEEA